MRDVEEQGRATEHKQRSCDTIEVPVGPGDQREEERVGTVGDIKALFASIDL